MSTKAFEKNFKAHSNVLSLAFIADAHANVATAIVVAVAITVCITLRPSRRIIFYLNDINKTTAIRRKKREKKQIAIVSTTKFTFVPAAFVKMQLTNKRFSPWTIFILYSNEQKKKDKNFFYPTDSLSFSLCCCLVSGLFSLPGPVQKRRIDPNQEQVKIVAGLSSLLKLCVRCSSPRKKSSSSSSSSSSNVRKHARNYSSFALSFVHCVVQDVK